LSVFYLIGYELFSVASFSVMVLLTVS